MNTGPQELKRRRVSLGMSQEELALAAGVSRGTVKNAERGNPRMEEPTRARLLSALDRAERGLLGQSEDTRPGLVYIGLDGTTHAVDAETWAPSDLSGRERVVLRALLAFALARLEDGAS